MNRQKQHSTPEFRVIRQNEANAKFFVASEFTNAPTSPSAPSPAAVTSLNVQSTTGWF